MRTYVVKYCFRKQKPQPNMSKTSKAKRVYGGTPMEQRVAERRRSLLAAAFEIIGELGHRALTVRAVCKKAGLTDRYFYESFDNGEALLIAVHQSLQDELNDAMNRAMAEHADDLEQAVRASIVAYLAFMRDPRKARVLIMEILGVSDKVTEHYLQSTLVFSETFLQAAEPHLSKLDKSSPERVLLGEALLGALVYAGNTWVMTDYQFPEQLVVDTSLRVLMGTLEQYR